jgi:thiol-disulfide isomerase/thioredoxin
MNSRLRLLLFFAFSFFFQLSYAAHPQLAVVRGKLSEPLNAVVVLSQASNGSMKMVASYKVGANAEFAFALPLLENGFFSITVNQVETKQKNDKNKSLKTAFIPVYVKAGSEVELNIMPTEGNAAATYEIISASPENKILHDWYTLVSPITLPVQNNTDVVSWNIYYRRYQQLLSALQNFQKRIQVTSNPQFTQLMKVMADADIRFSPLQFFNEHKELRDSVTYKAIKPTIERMLMQIKQYNNAKILDIGRGDILVSLYKTINELTTNDETDWKKRIEGKYINKITSYIVNDTLKGFFIAKQLEYDIKLKNEDMVQYIDPLKPYLVLDYMKDSYNAKMATLSGTKKPYDVVVDKNKITDIHWEKKNPSIAIVSGFIDTQGLITLSKVVNGDMTEVSSATIFNNRFYFAVPVKKEGFYYISTVAWSFRIYLTPGNDLEVSINNREKNSTAINYQVIKGSPENQLINEWFRLSSPFMVYANNGLLRKDTTSLESYITTYNQAKEQVQRFKKSISTGNPYFNTLFKAIVNQDEEFGPFMFLDFKSKQSPRQPTVVSGVNNKYSAFYTQFIKPDKFCNASLLQVKETKKYMDLYTNLKLALLPENERKAMSESDKLNYMVNSICNDTLKAYFINNKLDDIYIENLSEFKSTFQPVKKYLILDELKRNYDEKISQFIGDTLYLGKPVFNFSFPDTSGKMVSLSSLKGKVVVIDVWATWCGPCKEQLPYFKKIEEEYYNREDIAFISLSQDRLTDNQKWIDFVKKEKLPGIQLIDHPGKEFARKYAITGIPRFLLIDKQGKFIEVKLPRPDEHEAFTMYLDAALKTN